VYDHSFPAAVHFLRYICHVAKKPVSKLLAPDRSFSPAKHVFCILAILRVMAYATSNIAGPPPFEEAYAGGPPKYMHLRAHWCCRCVAYDKSPLTLGNRNVTSQYSTLVYKKYEFLITIIAMSETTHKSNHCRGKEQFVAVVVVVVGVVVVVVVVAVAVLNRSSGNKIHNLVGCLICSWPALPLAVMCEFSCGRGSTGGGAASPQPSNGDQYC